MQFEKQVEILQQGKNMEIENMERFLKQKLNNARNRFDKLKEQGQTDGFRFNEVRNELVTMNKLMASFLKEFKGQSTSDYVWQ